MNPKTYGSPAAFKQALEQRLRSASAGGATLARRRQILVFHRFLARVVQVMGDAVILKGGLVLELRLERARTTKDVDLRLSEPSEVVLTKFQHAGRLDLGDFLSYEVVPDPQHPVITAPGMQIEGRRFRAAARLGGKQYGEPFGVDVAFADPIIGEPHVMVAENLLAFAGIAPPVLRLYPVESQIAEKLHVYTIPRERENSRVKDLPDLALLAEIREMDARLLRSAIERTFTYRKTHALPEAVPSPPVSWRPVYMRMADNDGLKWKTLDEVFAAVRSFLDPVLTGTLIARWYPMKWQWCNFL